MFSGSSIVSRLCISSSIKLLSPLATVRNAFHTSINPVLSAQPTLTTHAHLLKKGEVTPGLNSDVFQDRRQKLVDKIIKNTSSRLENDAVHLVIIPSATVHYMTFDIPYPFRQNTDFLYLCGFKEPDSVLVINASAKMFPDFKSTLFIPKQTPHSAKWEGNKMDLASATDFLNVDETLYTCQFENFLEMFMNLHEGCNIWYEYLKDITHPIHKEIEKFIIAYNGTVSVESPVSLLHELRLIKCGAEINLMRKTCQIASQAMKEVMLFSYSSNLESHLEAKMNFECKLRGADRPAFPPVVAGGDRANTIHYIANNQIIQSGDMILMDAGCDYHGYNSDMTRTWPIKGKFTNPQRDLYEVLLSVQEQLIQLCKSKLSLDLLFKIMCKKLGKGLQELNIIPKEFTEEQASEAAFAFCPHHVGHYLGMDVHDTVTASRSRALQSGMVITIEPGVYISKTNLSVPEEFRGLCARIEDDVLITEDGFEVLTKDCPKCIHEIESLFKNVA